MHFVVFLCTFFLFFSCFLLYLLLNLFASIPAFFVLSAEKSAFIIGTAWFVNSPYIIGGVKDA